MLERVIERDQIEGSIKLGEIRLLPADPCRGGQVPLEEGIDAKELVEPRARQPVEKDAAAAADIQDSLTNVDADGGEDLEQAIRLEHREGGAEP